MGELYLLLVVGLLNLSSFLLGAWVYHRGQIDKPPTPVLNLNKQEPEAEPEWDQI